MKKTPSRGHDDVLGRVDTASSRQALQTVHQLTTKLARRLSRDASPRERKELKAMTKGVLTIARHYKKAQRELVKSSRKLQRTDQQLETMKRKLLKKVKVAVVGVGHAGSSTLKALDAANVRVLSVEEMPAVPAAALRAKSGETLKTVLRHGAVSVTHHGKRVVVMITADDYQALAEQHALPNLSVLEAEFHRKVDRMQGPAAGKGFDTMLRASSQDLGAAAVAAAKAHD